MNSYNKLIADLYLYKSPIGVTQIILIQISRRSYPAYTYTEVPVGTTKHILILVQISRRSYRAYTCTEVPIGTKDLILVQKYL